MGACTWACMMSKPDHRGSARYIYVFHHWLIACVHAPKLIQSLFVGPSSFLSIEPRHHPPPLHLVHLISRSSIPVPCGCSGDAPTSALAWGTPHQPSRENIPRRRSLSAGPLRAGSSIPPLRACIGTATNRRHVLVLGQQHASQSCTRALGPHRRVHELGQQLASVPLSHACIGVATAHHCCSFGLVFRTPCHPLSSFILGPVAL